MQADTQALATRAMEVLSSRFSSDIPKHHKELQKLDRLQMGTSMYYFIPAVKVDNIELLVFSIDNQDRRTMYKKTAMTEGDDEIWICTLKRREA